jgi:hypothetical protein
MTPSTLVLPTAAEVSPWVDAVVRLWDDPDFYQEHRRRASAESRRWNPETLDPLYAHTFESLVPSRPIA